MQTKSIRERERKNIKDEENKKEKILATQLYLRVGGTWQVANTF